MFKWYLGPNYEVSWRPNNVTKRAYGYGHQSKKVSLVHVRSENLNNPNKDYYWRLGLRMTDGGVGHEIWLFICSHILCSAVFILAAKAGASVQLGCTGFPLVYFLNRVICRLSTCMAQNPSLTEIRHAVCRLSDVNTLLKTVIWLENWVIFQVCQSGKEDQASASTEIKTHWRVWEIWWNITGEYSSKCLFYMLRKA